MVEEYWNLMLDITRMIYKKLIALRLMVEEY
ncbi:hypothetical protein Goarm_000436, partial [Gossypium armourianum]|nr:hypothetical protein [Gossypium armourianum]